jgi:hypothetical protein
MYNKNIFSIAKTVYQNLAPTIQPSQKHSIANKHPHRAISRSRAVESRQFPLYQQRVCRQQQSGINTPFSPISIVHGLHIVQPRAMSGNGI